MSDRTLPHSLEAEKAVLGAIIMNGGLYDRVAEVLRAKDFFRDAHAKAFTAIGALINDRKVPVDLLTLKDELTRREWLDDCGGPAYLSAMTDGIPRGANAVYYAHIVREKANLRALIALASEMLGSAFEQEAAATTVIDAADRSLLSLQHGLQSERLVDLRESSGRLYQEIERRIANQGQLSGVDTGFKSINELTFGWQRGDLIVIAARPSIGKTAFILNSAAHAATLGKHVALFSLEMRRAQLENRMLSQLSGIDLTRIMGGWLGETDLEKLGEAMGKFGSMPIWIDDRGGQTVWDIRGACRRLKSEHGLDLVVIDYVQLMPGSLERRGATRNDEVTDISRRLKALADEVDVPVMLLSQLNRAGDARSDKKPILSDLRESGALEQDADLVGFLHRKHHGESGTTDFILEKQRNGPTGTVYLTLTRETQTFVDGGEAPPLPLEPEKPAKPRYTKGGWRR